MRKPKYKPTASSQSKALRYALSLKSVRPIAEELIGGKEVTVVDVGCGSWVYYDLLAIEFGKFDPKKLRIIGVDPNALLYRQPARFTRLSVSKKTEFEVVRATVETLRRVTDYSGYDFVLCFNPNTVVNLAAEMIKLLNPGGLFIISLTDQSLSEVDRSFLASQPNIRILANRENRLWRPSGFGFDRYIFVATPKVPETSEQVGATA